MITLLYIITATFIVSLIALIGIFTLTIKEKRLNKILLIFVSLSAGTLMGGAFLHLLPEALEQEEATPILSYVLIGFIIFFIIEKILHWRHCHKEHCDIHTFSYMNLFGDSIHNFIDGLIIAASFVTAIPLGLTTTFAIGFHEIPQEIGDYGVLVYGGFKKKQALLLNFITALTALVGGIIGYFISTASTITLQFLLPFAAGGFIYIAATDLLPEIKKEVDTKKSAATLVVFICGILIMLMTKLLFEG